VAFTPAWGRNKKLVRKTFVHQIKINQEINVTPQNVKSSNALAQDRTDLAVSRTMMAADRSLMAWIRTALSMISFGFTVYKILQGFHESGSALAAEHTPQNIGLFLIGLGTVTPQPARKTSGIFWPVFGLGFCFAHHLGKFG
jgi:uncharacterized membrane protein YidH (DUF202 family)